MKLMAVSNAVRVMKLIQVDALRSVKLTKQMMVDNLQMNLKKDFCLVKAKTIAERLLDLKMRKISLTLLKSTIQSLHHQ